MISVVIHQKCCASFAERKCFGIRLSPVLIVLSVFTISLAMGAYVRRGMTPEEDRRKDF